GARLYDQQLDGAEQGTLPCLEPRAHGDIHNDWTYRFCRGAEYPDFPYDGDGEDPRHRSAHVHGNAAIASAADIHWPGAFDWIGWNSHWIGAWLCSFMGRRPLALLSVGSRSLFD